MRDLNASPSSPSWTTRTGFCSAVVLSLGLISNVPLSGQLHGPGAPLSVSEPDQALRTGEGPTAPPKSVRAFGGPTVGFTRINHEDAVLLGIRAGVFVSERTSLAIFGQGLLNQVGAVRPSAEDRSLALGYGGFEVAFEALRGERTAVAVGLLAGGGSVGPRGVDSSLFTFDDSEFESFGIIEPRAEVGIHVRSGFQILLGGSYRLTSGVPDQDSSASAWQLLRPHDLDGPTLGIHLRFGRF